MQNETNLRDSRENASESPIRKERSSKEDVLLSEAEQRENARRRISETENSYLPDVPQIPGYHSFWASTTSTTTPVQYYRRRGYTPILLTDIPADKRADYEGKEGHQKADYAGMVMVNEMLAMKIPEFEYQEAMKIYHHEMPLQHDAKMIEAQAKIEAIAPGGVKTGEGFEQGLGSVNKGKGPARFE